MERSERERERGEEARQTRGTQTEVRCIGEGRSHDLSKRKTFAQQRYQHRPSKASERRSMEEADPHQARIVGDY